ncbi:MAG: DPP IV N-terminal domain-containing protein, partial [Desulfatiglandales bacterium]
SSFWYAEGAPANTIIWKVDPRANTKTPLFDTARLRKELTSLLEHEPPYKGLPFNEFTFASEGEQVVKFSVEDRNFELSLDTYQIKPDVDSTAETDQKQPRTAGLRSPDGQWAAEIRENNLWLRSTDDGNEVELTEDGINDYGWIIQGAMWSPDSSKIAVKRIDYRQVPSFPVVHWLEMPQRVEWRYPRSSFTTTKAGAPLPRTELFVVDIHSKRKIRIQVSDEPDVHIHIVAWSSDGSELFFLKSDRTLKKVDLMAAIPQSGAIRFILRESKPTFVTGINLNWWYNRLFSELKQSQRFLWMSERDGWNHLYLYDREGNLKSQLTEGDFPLVRVEAVDENTGWIYFTAHGDLRRLYDTHLYRVNLDGKGFKRLTDTKGRHDVRFAPSKKFFLDMHSTMDRPPVVELRRADGTLLRTLSEARIDSLRELGWIQPEEFVVKAADKETDLWGVLYKPFDFKPDRKYPVIEYIYGGPQLSEVPHSFINYWAIFPQALAQLGYIVFVVDARGTPERGKVFQDVAFGNLGRHEILDHSKAVLQLADQRPYMDLDRVGIFGHSYGGYMTLRAMLLAPDVYHVGVASASLADLYYGNAMEVYMGLPKDNQEGYEYGSNLPFAKNLKGKLLLIHGTSDRAVPFSEAMKMAEAFIQAGKPVDMLIMPERNHNILPVMPNGKGTYVGEAIRRYFQEHLRPGVEK